MLLAALSFFGFAFAADLVPLPGSEVKLPLERGFVVENRWVGVANPTTQGALMVTGFEVDSGTMIASLTPKALATQGVTIKSTEPVQLGAYAGTWMEGIQAGGRVWIALVGDSRHTWIFKGSAPTRKAGAAVVRMVKGAAWGDPVPAALAFEIEAPEGLLHAADLTGARMFTVDGTMGNTVGQTLFVVAPSLRAVPVAEATARGMFEKINGLEAVAIEQAAPVTHGARIGWDLRGQGVDAKTRAPMVAWQRLLFTPDGLYLRLLGVAPLAEADRWIPSWEAAAATLRDPPG